MSSNGRSGSETNPSIFLRISGTDTAVRELAWHDFHERYAAVIAGFAKELGAKSQEVDDLVQEVLIGFYARSPTFVYDPSKGRFRGYLKTCTCHVVRRRLGREARFRGVSLHAIDERAVEVEQAWNDVWEQALLRRALDALRSEIGSTKTFRAFERYVILDQAPQDVSREVGVHIDRVYRSKEKVTRMLREKIAEMRAEID
jgi:RNA polymerase sigma-70 factor (ECF subfamily)